MICTRCGVWVKRKTDKTKQIDKKNIRILLQYCTLEDNCINGKFRFNIKLPVQ